MRIGSNRILLLAGVLLILAKPTMCEAAEGGRHALLVGCTAYPNLDRSKWLDGPGNDVILMRHLLESRYHFGPGDVTTLTEAAGGADLRPTRANIEREFRRLAAESKPGDQVAILLSGHGSQQPDDRPDPRNDPEPDGLDELFLPADVGRWDGGRRAVANAIVDDELREWLRDIQRTGASVWLIVDSCHSGTMMRGAETTREVTPRDLGIPAGEIAGAARARVRGGHGAADAGFDVPVVVQGMAAIYASQPGEPTFEMPLPADVEGSKPYGLLTYTINEVLTNSTGPMTYRQLVEGVYSRYAAKGRRSPSPMIEGCAGNKTVLGEGTPTTSPIRLGRDPRGGLRVNAGSLHRLTAGTTLSVSPPGGEGQPGIVSGYVRVKERGVSALEAVVEPCPAPGSKIAAAQSDLSIGGVCEVASTDFGVTALLVAIDEKDGKGNRLPAADIDRLKRSLKGLEPVEPARGSMSRATSDPGDADWLLHQEEPGSRSVYLIPASGLSRTEDGRPAELFGPIPRGDEAGPWLRDRLGRIAAASNLIRVADAWTVSPRHEPIPGVKVEMRKLADENDDVGHSVEPGALGVELRNDEWVAFALKNEGRDVVDLTLLVVDSEYGIEAIFPTQFGLDNRLKPGEGLTRKFRVTVGLPGREHLILIAAKAVDNQIPFDFGFLGQSSVERAREAAGAVRGEESALASPLGELLLNARFRASKARGLVPAEVGRYDLIEFSWRTVR